MGLLFSSSSSLYSFFPSLENLIWLKGPQGHQGRGGSDVDGKVSGGLMSSGALHHDGIRSERLLFCTRLTASSVFLPSSFFFVFSLCLSRTPKDL